VNRVPVQKGAQGAALPGRWGLGGGARGKGCTASAGVLERAGGARRLRLRGGSEHDASTTARPTGSGYLCIWASCWSCSGRCRGSLRERFGSERS